MGKRLAQVGVDNTEENRRQFRQILFSADDRINSCLGGVIFFHETLYQHSDSGVSFVKMIRDRGVLIGVKVPSQIPRTAGIDLDMFDTASPFTLLRWTKVSCPLQELLERPPPRVRLCLT